MYVLLGLGLHCCFCSLFYVIYYYVILLCAQADVLRLVCFLFLLTCGFGHHLLWA